MEAEQETTIEQAADVQRHGIVRADLVEGENCVGLDVCFRGLILVRDYGPEDVGDIRVGVRCFPQRHVGEEFDKAFPRNQGR